MRRDSDTDSTDENDHDGALASDDEGIRVSTPNPELSGLASLCNIKIWIA
jgi:hypothetical protein